MSRKIIGVTVGTTINPNKFGGTVTDKQIASAVEAYLKENPVDYTLTEADKQEIAELTAEMVDVPTDAHINDLINTALSAIPNAAEVAY